MDGRPMTRGRRIVACSPPVDRPPPDTRDDEEKAEVARILADLPPDHPAPAAHERGADAVTITHLVGDPDLVRALIEACLSDRNRRLIRADLVSTSSSTSRMLKRGCGAFVL